MMKLEGANPLQFPFKLASPSFSDGPGLQDNIFIHRDPRWYKFFINYPARIANNDDHFLDFLFAHASFLLSWRLACAIYHFAYWFQGRIRKTNFHRLFYDPIKRIWSSFQPFKHFCRHFISTRFLIVIHIFLTIFAHNFLTF
jgi:hypothetical protein